MRELKKFYHFTEIIFFAGGFVIFLAALFLKNDFYSELVKFLFITFNLPYIGIAITYGLLSFKIKMDEKGRQSDVVDSALLLLGGSLFIMILFVFLAYPDKI